MKKRITEWFVKYRIWFFFVACILTLIALLFLHGSVYRYVIHWNGTKRLAKDARSMAIFHIYIWLATISLISQIFAGIPCYFLKNEIKKSERITYLITIGFWVLLLSASLIILGVFYA